MEIKQDPLNYRHHSEKNKRLIKKSLKECGAGRSILVDADDTVVAGNGVYEQAKNLGIKTRVIETDGSELVVVKRTDIHLTDRKRKELALADNATTDTSEWDTESLKADWTADELSEWDVDVLNEKNDGRYTGKIDGLLYEPTGENVSVNELYDTEKYAELMNEIEKSKLKKDVKNMLKLAASRHIVFDYRKIAEYYASAPAEIQRLMEKSALVVIDYASAIQNGLVQLDTRLAINEAENA